jgi:hypothetical protein
MAARALIADALDLRYRLPRLWGRVLTGGVRAWQARNLVTNQGTLGHTAFSAAVWEAAKPRPGAILA